MDIKTACEDCAPQPDPKYQKKHPREFVGKLIKKGFPYKGNKKYKREHLWIKVTGYRGKKH